MIDFLKVWLGVLAVIAALAIIIAIPITLNIIGLPYVGLVVVGVYATGFLAWVIWAANKYL